MPEAIIPELIKEAHNSEIAGHSGVFKTRERLRERLFWPGMETDIAEHVKHCKVCARTSPYPKDPKAPLQPLAQPQKPNDRIHLDLFGPLQTSSRGKRYVLVMTDAFTKIVKLKTLTDKTAKEVAKAVVQEWIYVYGVPQIIVTDQGSEFCNDTLREIMDDLKIEHRTTTPYHPQSNSQAEVFNKTGTPPPRFPVLFACP